VSSHDCIAVSTTALSFRDQRSFDFPMKDTSKYAHIRTPDSHLLTPKDSKQVKE